MVVLDSPLLHTLLPNFLFIWFTVFFLGSFRECFYLAYFGFLESALFGFLGVVLIWLFYLVLAIG